MTKTFLTPSEISSGDIGAWRTWAVIISEAISTRDLDIHRLSSTGYGAEHGCPWSATATPTCCRRCHQRGGSLAMALVTVLTTDLGKNIVTCLFDIPGIIDQTAHRFRHVRETILGRHLFQEPHHVLFKHNRVRGFI